MPGKMTETTLCHLERDGAWLMLHRVKKKQDMNEGKWIGVGGHVEEGETPEEATRREIFEETGLTAGKLEYRGILYFYNDLWEDEVIHVYTSTDFTGMLRECDEGELAWIPKEEILSLNLWEGDKIFLKILLEEGPFFKLTLRYHGDELLSSELETKEE